MPTITVSVPLPFYLQLEEPLTVLYEVICVENQLKELVGQDIEISFSRYPAPTVGGSESSFSEIFPNARTTVAISVEAPENMPDETVGRFAIRDCLEIINKIITAYQATTGQVSNSGFILPLGTSDMQLSADIRVDGRDIRDRWPLQGGTTMSLPSGKVDQLKRYLVREESLPLSSLFLTNGTVALERGQYALAVVQVATGVELQVTTFISNRLKEKGWDAANIAGYERRTLGPKLDFTQPDARSLATYLTNSPDYAGLNNRLKSWFAGLRNNVVHRGYIPTHPESIEAVQLAHRFVRLIS